MRRVLFSVLAVCALALPHFLQGAERPSQEQEIVDNTSLLIDGTNRFAWRLFTTMLKRSGDNFVITPISLSSTLSIAYFGAQTDTAAEMCHVLDYTDQEVKDLAKSFNQLDRLVRQSLPLYESHYHLWRSRELTLAHEYRQTCQMLRGGGWLTPLSYRHPVPVTRQIDSFVKRGTISSVTHLVPNEEIDSATRMSIASTLHTQLGWTMQFLPSPNKLPFTNGSGQEITMPYLESEMTCPFGEFAGYSMISLPIQGIRNDLTAVFVIPHSSAGITSLLQNLSLEQFQADYQRLKPKEVSILLPRFVLQNVRSEMKSALVKLGMQQAFSADANFFGIDSENALSLDTVVAGATLQLDETGLHLDTATAVNLRLSDETTENTGDSYGTRQRRAVRYRANRVHKANGKTCLIADRPFALFVLDPDSNLILSISAVWNPQE